MYTIIKIIINKNIKLQGQLRKIFKLEIVIILDNNIYGYVKVRIIQWLAV